MEHEHRCYNCKQKCFEMTDLGDGDYWCHHCEMDGAGDRKVWVNEFIHLHQFTNKTEEIIARIAVLKGLLIPANSPFFKTNKNKSE